MLRTTTIAAALVVAASAATAAPIVHTTESGFHDALAYYYTETFESAILDEPIDELDFRAGLDLPVTSSASHNRAFEFSDGYGAVNKDGQRGWKLAKGETTLDIASANVFSSGVAFQAFGFWYSDLEWSDLDITLHTADGSETVRLSDNNPDQSRFFGLVADADLEAVTLAWTTNHNDGVGFDRMFLGATALPPAIPAPATLGVTAMGVFLAVRRRR